MSCREPVGPGRPSAAADVVWRGNRPATRPVGIPGSMTPGWGGLFPPDLEAAWLFGDPRDEPGERWAARLPESAVPRRRNQFAAGRLCAGHVCDCLGASGGAVGIGESGEPVWPAAVVGSISHTDGLAMAAAGWAAACMCIGVDVELNAPLPAEAAGLVLSARERAWVGERRADDVPWDRLILSAKEAVFKAWYPLARAPLDFSGIELEMCPGSTSFTATVLEPGGLGRIRGRFCVVPDFLFTAVAVPRPL